METMGKENDKDNKYLNGLRDVVNSLVINLSKNNETLTKMYLDYIIELKIEEAFEVCNGVLKRDDLRIDLDNEQLIEWIRRLYEVREKLYLKYLEERDIIRGIKICTFSIEYESVQATRYGNAFSDKVTIWIERLNELKELENRNYNN